MAKHRLASRGLLAGAVGLAGLALITSCSETPLKPSDENYSAGVPRASLSSEFDQYQFLGYVTDDQGANDTPAQSDLNAFTRADNVTGKVGVKWFWDDINSWTGTGQTGDACALFDTDNDGKANAAVCVRISNPNGDPTAVAQLESPASPLNYSCGDSKTDRCASPAKTKALSGITCEVEKVEGEQFFTTGDDGADVLAACSIPLSAISASSTPNLLNVCSFPSGSPNSNPFDCVVTPGAGFLVIRKATTPQASGLSFKFTMSPALVIGDSVRVLDNTSSVEETALLSATPGNAYSISEAALPSGWELSTASCARQTSPTPTPTGSRSGSTISAISITSGETTVCTFSNQVSAPTISVVKSVTPDSIPETGGNVTFSVVVTNNASIAVTLDSLKDNKFGLLAGQGTCNGSGNAYGSIAAGQTYSCSFAKTLAASNAGTAHIDTAAAFVSSDGGPASASDSARVRYIDVKPNITVTKSADVSTITATGGLSVVGFSPDQTFTGSGGGGGGSNPIFATDICDDQGANDEPDQSDMNCFSRADNVSGRLYLRWTWDDINAWTGTGQTGDACALLDTDGNSKANYAFCVRVTNLNGDPNQIVQAAGSPILYKCKDVAGSGEPDRCATKYSIQTLDATSVCAVSLTSEHFPGEGSDGQDTQAQCNLKLSDLGNVAIANIDLLNVCSFPSGSPNSNPFDCVVSPAAGFLVISEATNPSTSTAVFGFRLLNGSDSTVNAAATNGDDEFGVQAGATSPGIPMAGGTYALKQLMPSGWSLDSIVCTRDGNPVGTTSGTRQLNLTIVAGQTTTCTFTNSLVASQSVTFTVTVTNNSLEDVTLFSLEDSENPDAATPTYSTLNGVGTCVTGGTIANGTPYSCTFSRTVSGTPGTQHKDKVRAVGKDNEANSDTKYSGVVTVSIN